MIFARLRKENPKVKERQGRIEARRKGLKEKADTLDTDLWSQIDELVGAVDLLDGEEIKAAYLHGIADFAKVMARQNYTDRANKSQHWKWRIYWQLQNIRNALRYNGSPEPLFEADDVPISQRQFIFIRILRLQRQIKMQMKVYLIVWIKMKQQF